MPAFALAIFTGAFLLFLVQPLIAKFILPWFGGTPAVWSTCMLFFQLLLLGGYAYAHWSIRTLKPRQQVIFHLVLLGVALLWIPIAPGEIWKPADGNNPSGRILLLLLATIGLPYLALAATGPLFQAWFAEAQPGKSPYRLYALSNIGSLLALFAYPFLMEPNLTRHAQAWWWSGGLIVFVALTAWCGSLVIKTAAAQAERPSTDATVESDASAAAGSVAGRRLLWLALPAVGTTLLLAVTNKICQDIAVIPFLWILPLSLYLLSFIICFDSPRWYWRPFWLPALAISIGAVLSVIFLPSFDFTAWYERPLKWLSEWGDNLTMPKEIAVYLTALFVCCMTCHGELFRLRPAASRLTGYYLAISAGGALGGSFVALVAPAIFRHYHELQLGFFLACLLVVAALFFDPAGWLRRPRNAWSWFLLFPVIGGIGGALYHTTRAELADASELTRNFYGVLKVYESHPDNPTAHKFLLQHGGTTHGLQFVDEYKRRLPSSYYVGSSGVGLTMKHFPKKEFRRVGVIGLGAGSLIVYGKPGDYWRIYEINPVVPRLANQWFTYLKDTPAETEVVLGDARLSLEREEPQGFDILVLDAFSSDAIPVHLLTREAFEVYQRHVDECGAIVVHISNRHLDLLPVVQRISEHFGYEMIYVSDDDVDEREEDEETSGAYTTDWVVLTKDPDFARTPELTAAADDPYGAPEKFRMWTDEESNLFHIFRWED